MTGRDQPHGVSAVADLREQIAAWRQAGDSVALVPTMGALHDGHLSLVRAARERASRVVVTLFINPTQFGENEDLDTYPRDEDRDRALLSAESVDLLFVPDVQEMYPPDDTTRVHVGDMGTCLEGEYRPGFFIGVATVVAKLLIQALPDYALFGEKDFQQLQVIRRMVRDMHIPVDIVGIPTVREDDGLALSSRNAYLGPEERQIAPSLYKIITCAARTAANDGDVAAALNMGRAALLSAGFKSVDYLSYRHGETLMDLSRGDEKPPGPGRILVAATLGRTRLIDNVEV